MLNSSDLIGLKFYNLTVLERIPNKKYIIYKCLCDCGVITATYAFALKSGKTKSCGCLKSKLLSDAHTTHGKSRPNARTRVYSSWVSMKQRCLNENNDRYRDYGGRGIKVCNEWMTFRNFYNDMGDRPEGKTIDRIDNNGNYEKSNCKWSTHDEQCLNRREKRKRDS
jgi:hypothetical protein